MWEMAIGALSTDRQWMGWVISFARKECYRTRTCYASKNNPYPILKPEDIFENLGVQGGFGVANLVSLFALIPG
jgi:hypothetical protein